MSEWLYCIKECTYVKTCTKNGNRNLKMSKYDVN